MNIHRFILILILLNFNQFYLRAGTSDSLLKQLTRSGEDTSRFSILIELAAEFKNSEPAKSVEYCKQAIELSKKLHYEEGFARAYGMEGVALTNLGKYDEAKKVLEDGLTYALKTKLKDAEARIYNSIAVVNYYQSDFLKSIDNHTKSIKVKEEIGDRKGVAYSLNNISHNYYALGKYSEVISNAKKALEILKEENDSLYIPEVYNTIGTGNFAVGNYPEALKNFLISISLREKLNDKNGIAACLLNIGSIYQNQKKYKESNDYYLRSLKLYEEVGNENLVGTIYYAVGTNYMYEGNNEKALDLYLKAIPLKEKSGDKSVLALTYSNIGEVYYLKNQFNEALEYHFKGLEIKQEIGEGSKITATKTLKWVSELLQEHLFFRVHDSHLVNLNHIKSYKKGGEGGVVLLSEKQEVDVSRRRKDEFLERLAQLRMIPGQASQSS